ncbi:MAG: hypothetical protein HYR84_04955 [Planctomycetes bacterium]|nr:hypothetical protein [Planctomycetota bacterium]
MFRSIHLLASTLFIAGLTTFPSAAGEERSDVSPERDRQKIIQQLQSDFQNAADRLKKNDPGALTRKQQDRIIDGLNKLIDDPPPSPPSPPSPPRPPSAPPPSPPPPPSPDPRTPETKPAPSPPPAVLPKNEASPSEKTPKSPNAQGEPKRTPEALEKLLRETKTEEDWARLPPRVRQELDAYARGRLMPRYQDLLRAYYRSLADPPNANPDP